MKFKKFIVSAVFTAFLMVSYSSLIAQSGGQSGEMTINEQLQLEIDTTGSNEIRAQYEVDISILDFTSQSMLDSFCANFSFDFQRLEGNLAGNRVTVYLDQQALAEREFGIGDLNDHFSRISRRMEYLYYKLKESQP
ncbi:MAG: hypothetical protein AAF489_11010 [Bacteroidota bacterium]